MPWKASTPVDLRKEFIMRLGGGERLTDLCREYGIARKTGEKFKRRFRADGLAGLQDRSRAAASAIAPMPSQHRMKRLN